MKTFEKTIFEKKYKEWVKENGEATIMSASVLEQFLKSSSFTRMNITDFDGFVKWYEEFFKEKNASSFMKAGKFKKYFTLGESTLDEIKEVKMKSFKEMFLKEKTEVVLESLSGLENNNKLYSVMLDALVDKAWGNPTAKKLNVVIEESLKYIIDGLVEDLKDQIKYGDVDESEGKEALDTYLKMKKMTIVFK